MKRFLLDGFCQEVPSEAQFRQLLKVAWRTCGVKQCDCFVVLEELIAAVHSENIIFTSPGFLVEWGSYWEYWEYLMEYLMEYLVKGFLECGMSYGMYHPSEETLF